YAADDLELGRDFAVLEADVVFLAAALDPAFELARERIDDGHADAMQAAGELVGLVRELAAGVQPREDQLDAADLLLRMDIDGHAATVVGHFQRPVLVEYDVDLLAVAGQGLIDAVVDDLVRQMVRTLRMRVHPGPAPYGLQAGEDFDVGSGIGLIHGRRSI